MGLLNPKTLDYRSLALQKNKMQTLTMALSIGFHFTFLERKVWVKKSS